MLTFQGLFKFLEQSMSPNRCCTEDEQEYISGLSPFAIFMDFNKAVLP